MENAFEHAEEGQGQSLQFVDLIQNCFMKAKAPKTEGTKAQVESPKQDSNSPSAQNRAATLLKLCMHIGVY